MILLHLFLFYSQWHIEIFNFLQITFSVISIFIFFVFILFPVFCASLCTMPPRQAPIIVLQANTDSVFYVHPSEGPSYVVVTPLLTSSNYLAWSRFMKRALGAKNKFAFVDGSIPIPPSNDMNRSAWECCNPLIHYWILNSISPQIAQTIVFHEYAIDVWIELQERFSRLIGFILLLFVLLSTISNKVQNICLIISQR